MLEEALLNSIIKTEPSIQQSGNSLTLVGQVESLPIVTDRAITLAFALIVPDQVFDSYTGATIQIMSVLCWILILFRKRLNASDHGDQ